METYKSINEYFTAKYPCKYVRSANSQQKLGSNEYYALMVATAKRKQNVEYCDPINGLYWVGIEKASGENGYYISKDYYRRKTSHRGVCIIIEVAPENMHKFFILS